MEAVDNTNLAGLNVTNKTSSGDLEVHGTIQPIKSLAHGQCTAGLTFFINGELHVGMTLTATTESGKNIISEID
jgi:hypothetical protein